MKKKGFTLIELVIVVAIVAVLLTTASLSVKKITEDRAVEEAKSEVAETIKNYVIRAYNEGQDYRVEIKSIDGDWKIESSKIRITEDEDGNEVKTYIFVEGTELPQILKYSTSPSGGAIIETDVTVDETVEIYIEDGESNPRYVVEVLKKSVSGLMDVNTYRYDDFLTKE